MFYRITFYTVIKRLINVNISLISKEFGQFISQLRKVLRDKKFFKIVKIRTPPPDFWDFSTTKKT